VNLKGGVGKTALAVNFAAYCGMRGLKTLLVDLDPQTNATFSCMEIDAWEALAAANGTVADLLDVRQHTSAEGARRDIHSVIAKDVFPGMDLIPSHLDLFTIDLDLASTTARETKLRRALQPITNEYQMIVCDCPPNLTIPTQNAIAVSTHYAVPISPDYLSGIGVGLLISRITQLCSDLEHSIKCAGLVISRVGRPALHRAETEAALRQQFKDQVLRTTISERVRVSQAAAEHRPIYDMGDDNASAEFQKVSSELLNRMGVKA
jgi:chromosome partitioning protein